MEPNNKYPERLRALEDKRAKRLSEDNKTKVSYSLSISTTPKMWSKKKHAVKLLRTNNITVSELISSVLLELDQNLIDELIRLNVLKKND